MHSQPEGLLFTLSSTASHQVAQRPPTIHLSGMEHPIPGPKASFTFLSMAAHQPTRGGPLFRGNLGRQSKETPNRGLTPGKTNPSLVILASAPRSVNCSETYSETKQPSHLLEIKHCLSANGTTDPLFAPVKKWYSCISGRRQA